jgi:predicted DNA-binding transcriptional regulator AlpA
MTPQEAERRRRQRERDYDSDMARVMSLATFLERNNLSKPTLWRLRKAGLGPKTVRLGERRLGITYAAELEWQQSRAGA